MNRPEDRLSNAFKYLAADAPKSAPTELGVMLKESFRRRQVRRKRLRVYTSAALLACTALALFVFVTRSPREETGPSPVEAVQADDPNVKHITQDRPTPEKLELGMPKERDKVARRKRSYSHTKDFVPLPTYHPSVASEAYQVVRVGLRDQSLSQLGLPIREDASGRRLVADLLVDRDGLPMAVRFVGWRK